MSLHYLDLIRCRSAMELRSESSQAYLGTAWWIFEPLLYLLTFYLVFEVLFQRGGEGYVGFLLCGLVFWRWFDVTIKKAAVSIQANVGIINQVYIPKIVFPVVEWVVTSYKFVFILLIFLIFVLFYKREINVSWAAMPLLLLVQALMSLGVGLCVSAVVPFVPDVRKVIDNLMMFMFYMSGIFFDIARLSEEAQAYLSLNPMAVLLQQYRAVLLDGRWPDWGSLMMIASVSLALVLLGWKLISVADRVYPRIIRV